MIFGQNEADSDSSKRGEKQNKNKKTLQKTVACSSG